MREAAGGRQLITATKHVSGTHLRWTPRRVALPKSPLGYLREKNIAAERKVRARPPDPLEQGTEGRARAARAVAALKIPECPGKKCRNIILCGRINRDL